MNIYKAENLLSLMVSVKMPEKMLLSLFMSLAKFFLAHEISLSHVCPSWLAVPVSLFFLIRL